MLFEQVPDRHPILAGGFHRDLGHSGILQPLAQFLQIAGEGAEGPFTNFHICLAHGRQDTHGHVLLMYVDAATAAVLGFHKHPWLSRSPTQGRLETLTKRLSYSCSSPV